MIFGYYLEVSGNWIKDQAIVSNSLESWLPINLYLLRLNPMMELSAKDSITDQVRDSMRVRLEVSRML
jgi:hypothetical protein